MDEETTAITIPLLDNECAICYETMCTRDVLYPCKHHIHTTCFLKTKSRLCPLCRQVVKNPKPNCRRVREGEGVSVHFDTKQFICILGSVCGFYTGFIILSLMSHYND